MVTDIENAHLLTDQGIGRRDDAQHVQAPAKPGIRAFAQGLNCESRTLQPLGLFTTRFLTCCIRRFWVKLVFHLSVCSWRGLNSAAKSTINNGKVILCVDGEAIGLFVRKMLLESKGLLWPLLSKGLGFIAVVSAQNCASSGLLFCPPGRRSTFRERLYAKNLVFCTIFRICYFFQRARAAEEVLIRNSVGHRPRDFIEMAL